MKQERTQTSYTTPEVEIILFELSDIVTTSTNGKMDSEWDEW